jgi:hypothetical protein
MFHKVPRLPDTFSIIQAMKKATISTATIVEPTGAEARMETRMPVSAQNTDSIAEQIVTALKLLNILIADNAGKITKAETNKEPTRFMASTTITATTTAIKRLYNFAFVPVACAKLSSKVTAKILL